MMSTRSQPTSGLVESVNVGTPRLVPTNGHSVLTAIWKRPIQGPVALRGVNLRGDFNPQGFARAFVRAPGRTIRASIDCQAALRSARRVAEGLR